MMKVYIYICVILCNDPTQYLGYSVSFPVPLSPVIVDTSQWLCVRLEGIARMHDITIYHLSDMCTFPVASKYIQETIVTETPFGI